MFHLSVIICFLIKIVYSPSSIFASSGKIDTQNYENFSVVNLDRPNTKALQNTQVLKRNIIDSDGWVRVGVLLPLSGKNREIGNSLKSAMQIALFSATNNKIILQFYDTNDILLSLREITKNAISERVNVILGPLFGKEIYDIAGVAKNYDIPVISFSNDEKLLSSEGVYSINYLISQEIDQIVGFASLNGYKTLSVIIPEDENDDLIEDIIKKSVKKYSSTLYNIVKYKKGDQTSISESIKEITDYHKRNNVANKIKEIANQQLIDLSCNENLNNHHEKPDENESPEVNENIAYCENLNKLIKSLSSIKGVGHVNFDTIFVYGDINDLISIGSYLSYYDINSTVKIIGTSNFDNKKIFAEHGYYGAWFTGKNNFNLKSFENEYKNIFNKTPSKLAMLAYDAVSVVANSIKDGELDMDKLNNPGGFFGISGLFKFNDRGVTSRTFEIKEVLPRTFRTIKLAEKSFNEMNINMQESIKNQSHSKLKELKKVDLDWILENLKTLKIEEINSFLIK